MKEVYLMDERGRITLGKKERKKFGKKFWKLSFEDKIVLKPIPKDPIAELQRMWKEAGLDKYTAKQIKKMAEEEAEKEVREGYLRSQRAHSK